ncbi:M1 family metallopeptidase [Cytobacillus sp. FJAT-54145]|uniref:M1 family metallopeptidase n=1 Tax=Cytobacillus spartinae TaxID=3299023 RepID=A0ABW6K8I1_9BACI
MKRVLFAFMALLILVAGCSKETNGKKEEEVNQSEENTEVKDGEKEQVEEKHVEEAIVFKKSSPIKMDKSLPLETLDAFKVQTRENENEASYHLDLTLKEDDVFDVVATINVKNLSQDVWDDMIFHFIPNAFTEENKPEYLESKADVSIREILIDDNSVDYRLQHDNLQILLEHPLHQNEEQEVKISYSFTVPTDGIRLSKMGKNFYLAQWYPMLSPYHSGWDKMDYGAGESYHSDFSNFTVDYHLPEDFIIASSADNDPIQKSREGKLAGENIKEFYMTFMKDMNVSKREVDGTEIRVFSYPEDDSHREKHLELAAETLLFFNENFGQYPHKQLDIIMDEGGMEYPGIVTVSKGGPNAHTVIHEIAHQWFYGMVSNHPYYTPWIDEALTNYATYLFFMKGQNQGPGTAFTRANDLLQMGKSHGPMKPSNLHTVDYTGQPMSYVVSVYENSSLELWELSGENADVGLDYLRKYFNLYAYKEVDANEWLRYTRAFFQIEDVSQLSDWISFEE